MKASKETEKMFPGGKWTDTVDKYNKPCKAYMVPEKDRQTYVDRSVMVNMMLLRKTFAEKAMTGAILRVIRALTGLKGTYTIQELKKPFAIPRVTFAPDYSNPEVRQLMLSQGMNSMGNMFGTTAIPSSNPATAQENQADMDFKSEEFVDNPAFASDITDSLADDLIDTLPEYDSDPFPPEPVKTDKGDVCSNCGRAVSAKVLPIA